MPSAISNSTQIIPQPQSPLLRLPGEIRNIIFDYALLDHANIHGATAMLPTDINDPDAATRLHIKGDDDNWHEINQLKYVCRQLYFETRSYGLNKFTLLEFPVFTRFDRPYAMQFYPNYDPGLAFTRFFESCDRAYLANTLERVIISYEPPVLALPGASKDKDFEGIDPGVSWHGKDEVLEWRTDDEVLAALRATWRKHGLRKINPRYKVAMKSKVEIERVRGVRYSKGHTLKFTFPRRPRSGTSGKTQPEI